MSKKTRSNTSLQTASAAGKSVASTEHDRLLRRVWACGDNLRDLFEKMDRRQLAFRFPHKTRTSP